MTREQQIKELVKLIAEGKETEGLMMFAPNLREIVNAAIKYGESK